MSPLERLKQVKDLLTLNAAHRQALANLRADLQETGQQLQAAITQNALALEGLKLALGNSRSRLAL